MAASRPRIVLVGDARKERSAGAISHHEPWLRRRCDIVARDLDGTLDLSRVRADLVVLFGGDGSILSVARRLDGNTLPVLGVNTGRFGFLAEVTLEAFRDVAARVFAGRVRTSDRMMFDVAVSRAGRTERRFLALNDAVIARGSVSRMAHMRLHVGGEPLSLFSGDGLIVATPSGSTAHSLSAGGPIVHPELAAVIVTPICPHTLSSRPIVLPADRRVRIDLERQNGEVVLTVDGQEMQPLLEGHSVTVARAKKPFRLVDTGTRPYYDALRSKMGWGGAFVSEPR